MTGGRDGVALSYVFVGMLVLAVSARREQLYTPCHTGKGDVKLYNCGQNEHNLARLQVVSSPTRYIVKLKENIESTKVDEICLKAETNNTAYPGYCIHKFKIVWTGMLLVMSGDNLYRLLDEEMHNVEHVEVEGVVRVSASVVTITTTNVTQTNPPSWGLDRIDRKPSQPDFNNLYTVTNGGTGVHIYVIDTGIRCSHVDFLYSDGRVDSKKVPMTRCLAGFDTIGDGYGTNDCNGHGTHCAGIVAGLQSGVAKSAFVHPVRALSCDGSGGYGMIMASLDWISFNAIMPAIISMSLAAPASISIDQVITNLMDMKGILVVVAAGNFHEDACQFSPSRILSALSVGSSTNRNLMSWFSNYGPCTTIIAPGELITSAWNTSNTAYNTLSGTSMACPHVAGAAALYLSQFDDARPKDVKQALLDACEPGAVGNVQPNTTTKLLNVVNIMQPSFTIKPRSFYNVNEGTTQSSMISLRVKPTSVVLLTPSIGDSTIGYFQPSRICFPNDASWSIAQTIKFVVSNRTDYLDRGSKIQWLFTSQDANYNVSPEGYVFSLDTKICRWSTKNPCGQTIENPKIIPKLPFKYLDNSFLYKNIYDVKMDYCHNIGPDVVFQYTAISNVNVRVSLNETNTNFDTLLSAYEKTLVNNVSKLTMLDCNDDAWNEVSVISSLLLKAGRTYIFIIDGWSALGGLFDLIVQDTKDLIQSYEKNSLTSSSTQISAQNHDKEASTKWNGRIDTDNLPIPSQPQKSYFWSAISWGPCNRLCGGGIQESLLKCYMGNYIEVDSTYCKNSPHRKQSQECNVIECRSYNIYVGPWSECNNMCGQGNQTRIVTCMDNLGNTAPSQQCVSKYDLVENTKICNAQKCNATYWEVTDWEFCNVPCGSGKSFREAICRSQFQIEKDSACAHLPPPATEKICNTHPCQTHAWLVGPWSDCNGVCCANQTRQVQCVDGLGTTCPLEFCDTCNKPISIMPCLQSNVICKNSLENYCSEYGHPQGGQCVCEEGWEGPLCEKYKKCHGRPLGVYGGKLDCCPYHMIDINSKCCTSAVAKLTSDGMCCEEGKLDACGQCNGIAKFVDSQHTCCNTIRDEKGICCLSGLLDECHVCDGDGITCATNITMSISFGSNWSISNQVHEKWKSLLFVFVPHVATKLGLADDAIILTSIQLSSVFEGDCTNNENRAQACLSQGSYKTLGTIDLTLFPKPKDHLKKMITKQDDIREVFQAINFSKEISINGTKTLTSLYIEDMPKVQKSGICGNGVCEKGERCDFESKSAIQHGDNICCFQDCPYVSLSCPISLSGPYEQKACSGNGMCLDASGQCKCFLGYAGKACEQCIIGWTKVKNGTLCIKMTIPKAFIFTNILKNATNDSSKSSESGSNALMIVLTIALLATIAYFIFHWWSNSIQRHPHQRISHVLENT